MLLIHLEPMSGSGVNTHTQVKAGPLGFHHGKTLKSCSYEVGYINANCIGDLLEVLERESYVNVPEEQSEPITGGECGKSRRTR